MMEESFDHTDPNQRQLRKLEETYYLDLQTLESVKYALDAGFSIEEIAQRASRHRTTAMPFSTSAETSRAAVLKTR